MIVLYFDGACEPCNPGGIATYGFVAVKDGKIVYQECGLVCERGTNNIAEYTAVIRALEWARSQGYRRVAVRGDSQLVIRQLRGEYRVKSPNIKELYEKAKSLLKSFEKAEPEWVRREENILADRLSKKAYAEYCQKKSSIEGG